MHTIDRETYDEAVHELCEALGINPNELSEVTLRPGELVVVATYAVPYAVGGGR
jgi:hypothetical protein